MRWLTRIWTFFWPVRTVDAPQVAEATPVTPGARVRRPDGTEGTVTGRAWQGGRPVARVVWTGERASWVSLVDEAELHPA